MARPEPGAKGLDKWTAVLGGGTGMDVNKWLGADIVREWTGKKPLGRWEGTKEYSRYGGYMNVKESMILSIMTICLPGIIYNLQKYREIQCGYINCLEETMLTGIPADACDKVKEYQTCKYIYGEIFQAIPFTAFYNYFVNMIKNALSDPFSVIGATLGIACVHLCELPTEEPHALCIWSKIFAELGDIINNVKSIFSSDYWKIKNTYCHDVEERHENQQEKEAETTEPGNEGFTGLT